MRARDLELQGVRRLQAEPRDDADGSPFDRGRRFELLLLLGGLILLVDECHALGAREFHRDLHGALGPVVVVEREDRVPRALHGDLALDERRLALGELRDLRGRTVGLWREHDVREAGYVRRGAALEDGPLLLWRGAPAAVDAHGAALLPPQEVEVVPGLCRVRVLVLLGDGQRLDKGRLRFFEVALRLEQQAEVARAARHSRVLFPLDLLREAERRGHVADRVVELPELVADRRGVVPQGRELDGLRARRPDPPRDCVLRNTLRFPQCLVVADRLEDRR